MGGGQSRSRRPAQKFRSLCASHAGDSPPHPNTSTILSSSSKCSIKQTICTICLEPFAFNEDDDCSSSSKTFTAHCRHSFHLACIASNVRHGSVSCPVCRTRWSHLPRCLLSSAHHPSSEPTFHDPILRILDDSIATSRINRRHSLHSTRYDDDDPTEPGATSLPRSARLSLSLSKPFVGPIGRVSCTLFVRLAPQLPVDLVLVATPDGSHLRILKQAVALTVLSLRPADRLALVTCSPAAATRAFGLRRMSSHGKRAALQATDRLFYTSESNPAIGLQKAVRILEDRAHCNPFSCILHISDSPISGLAGKQHVSLPVHRFHVGFGFGRSNGFVMHEFEEFLLRILGKEVRDMKLELGEEGRVVRIDELRCEEERRIPVDFGADSDFIRVSYEYKESCSNEMTVAAGVAVLEIEEKGDESNGEEDTRGGGAGPRRSCVERWDYIDPFMARRWAKHLHGCKT